VWFDFHAELKHGRWDKLTNLLEQTKAPLLAHGYFRATVNASSADNDDDKTQAPVVFHVDRVQTGIVRTNCMDCLDRTNVVQSVFGRFLLFTQLSEYKKAGMPLAYKTAFRRNPLALPWNSGEAAHRLVWADNADAISSLYAGTPALKGDFTRTGKRTKLGALDDGMNSLQRFYLNNFLDAYRQEGMDLLVGFQPFGSSLDFPDTDLPSSPSGPTFAFKGESIQKAARKALLGKWKGRVEKDDHDHIRIKVKDKQKNSPLAKGGAFRQRRNMLDLRWLPGDLQSQVRSVAGTDDSLTLDDWESLTIENALEAMDQRVSNYLPWWFTTDSSSSSDSEINSAVLETETEAINNAGYLIGALVAGTQSPLCMAGAVLAVMSVAIPMNKT
jgi:hypothetical protein